jgi:reverse gyrase
MFVDLVKPTKHKGNEHLNGGEWIRAGVLESIKPTKHKDNEHLSEWIRTGLLESIKPTKYKGNEHLSGGTTEMFVGLVFSRFDTF